jgi:hypothetical protein
MCGGFLRIQFHQERFPPQAIAPSGRSLETSARKCFARPDGTLSVSVRVSVPKERRFSVATSNPHSALQQFIKQYHP